jgi:hypothetical protein
MLMSLDHFLYGKCTFYECGTFYEVGGRIDMRAHSLITVQFVVKAVTSTRWRVPGVETHGKLIWNEDRRTDRQ